LICFPSVAAAGLGLLVVTAPLASASMWAKQNLMEFDRDKVSQKFDLDFADDLFTNSFGVSLILNFLIFSIGEPVVNPVLLLSVGSSLIVGAALCYRSERLEKTSIS